MYLYSGTADVAAATNNEDYINANGFLGRSFGCPAIPGDNFRSIIDEIKNGSCLFLYSPNHYYLSHSGFLKHTS